MVKIVGKLVNKKYLMIENIIKSYKLFSKVLLMKPWIVSK